MAERQQCRLGRGPLLAWEKISTALYVHEWARQMKGCNPIFCYVNIRMLHMKAMVADPVFLDFTQGKPGGIPE